MNLSKVLLGLAAWTARVLPMPLKRAVYRIRPLAGLIRRGLNRSAPSGLSVVEVAAGALSGFRLALYLQTEKDYWLGTYEPEVQAALSALAQPGMVAYDVGANIGYISLQLARLAGASGQVYAFEALPGNQERLRRNIEMNGLAGQVEVVPAAVLDASRPARFLVAPSGGMGKAEGSAGRQDVAYADTIEVPGISLDAFAYEAGHHTPYLVKMDIEGGEVLALPGMRRLLSDARPILLMELHGPESARSAWETLTAAGYRICRMQPGFPPVAALDALDWKSYLAAFPDSDDFSRSPHRPQTTKVVPTNASPVFDGRLAVQQRVLPAYRAPFFDALARACTGGLSVFAGQPQADEQIPAAKQLDVAELVRAENRHFLSISSPFYQCRQPGLLAWLARVDPEVLIVEANPRYRSTPAAVRWMHTRGRTVLGWGLGAPALNGPLAAWRMRARRRFLQSLDGVIAYSRKGADEYVRIGFSPEQVFVAPNAAAARPASAPPERPLPLSGRPVVLFVGRLQARKRIDSLLHACSALPEALQPQVCVVGEGPARLEFEAAARRVYPAAEFAGAVYGADLDAYFARADLFVLPGTGGLAVQQAMAHGLPVIVAEGDGTQSDLVRPENGWRIPPDDLPALTAALRVALSDLPRLRRMGAEAYRIVAEEINLETMASRFVEAAVWAKQSARRLP